LTKAKNTRSEQWDFIYKVFPLVDLPFNALAIYSSDNWIVTMIIAIMFPVIASTILYLAEKKNFQAGFWIIGINGLLSVP
jgi:hypothetical protein